MNRRLATWVAVAALAACHNKSILDDNAAPARSTSEDKANQDKGIDAPPKREALTAHQSQKAWLDVSQGMDSYLRVMDEMSLAVGRMSGRFEHAEGWRRHAHMGFCAEDADPLHDALGRNFMGS